MIRKKWETEVEETLDKPVGPIHYQNVLFNGEQGIFSLQCTVYNIPCTVYNI